jgi:hypothetical protein
LLTLISIAVPWIAPVASGRCRIDLIHSYMIGDRWRDIDAGATPDARPS